MIFLKLLKKTAARTLFASIFFTLHAANPTAYSPETQEIIGQQDSQLTQRIGQLRIYDVDFMQTLNNQANPPANTQAARTTRLTSIGHYLQKTALFSFSSNLHAPTSSFTIKCVDYPIDLQDDYHPDQICTLQQSIQSFKDRINLAGFSVSTAHAFFPKANLKPAHIVNPDGHPFSDHKEKEAYRYFAYLLSHGGTYSARPSQVSLENEVVFIFDLHDKEANPLR